MRISAAIGLSLSFILSAGWSQAALGQAVLNEIRVDEPGADFNEYIEIAAAPGSSMNGLTYVVIGDDDFAFPPLQNGVIEVAVPLSGIVGASGFFVLAEASFTLGIANQYEVFNLESADNTTHLLVRGFTGAVGDDLDLNDDGILDSQPWTSVDSSVSLIEVSAPDGATSDFYYAQPTVGPDGLGASPAGATRCENGSWNLLAADAMADTPGAANPVCGGAVAVAFSEMRIDQTGTDNDEYVELVGAPAASLSGISIIAIGDYTDPITTLPDLQGRVESITDLTGLSIASDGRFLIAKPTFTLGIADFTTTATGFNFENSDNITFLLVTGFTGIMNQDLDTDDNGILDLTPWTAVLDEFAVKGSDSTAVYSATILGPDGAYVPGQVSLCTPDNTWMIGPFTIAAGGDTPGEANLPCTAYPVLECGELEAGACDTAHTTPYCAEANCCNAVCAIDPSCCQLAWDQVCADQSVLSCSPATSSCARGVTWLNEIRIDQTGTDLDEYIEIGGAPGTALTDLTIIVIGDGASTAGSGVIERAFSLAAATIPEDGTLLIGNTGMVLGTPDVSSGVASNWLENSDNLTFFLVSGFIGANGNDLDTNDDGVLDIIPWTAIVDEVAMIESATIPPTGTEWVYSTSGVGPEGVYVPGQIWRCQDTGCWNIGIFDPLAGSDTAGASNPTCGAPVCNGDVNVDGLVDGQDLAIVLGSWGEAKPIGDIDNNGQVDGADLALLLGSWGVCP